MKPIKIESTYNTPSVNFDFDKGVLSIKGRSIPEDSIGFYQPLFDIIEEYSKNPKQKTIVDIQLEYYNTNSARCFLDIFKRFEKIFINGNDVIVNWYYEQDDDDIMEAGEDFQNLITVPFNIIEITEE